jgi:hypothetical protein
MPVVRLSPTLWLRGFLFSIHCLIMDASQDGIRFSAYGMGGAKVSCYQMQGCFCVTGDVMQNGVRAEDDGAVYRRSPSL